MGQFTIAFALLASLITDARPWLHLEANSEQRQPVYFGLTPLELARGARPGQAVQLPVRLRALGESQLRRVRQALRLNAESVNFEVWPVLNDDGQMTWAIARYQAPSQPWQWLDSTLVERSSGIPPELPLTLRPWVAKERDAVFQDFLQNGDLYFKPEYGNCVWTDEPGTQARGAWLPPADLRGGLARFGSESRPGYRSVCHAVSQPARFEGVPRSLVAATDGARVSWPPGVEWEEAAPTSGQASVARAALTFSPDFLDSYARDVLALDGEVPLEFPLSGKRFQLRRKNAADPGNELLTLVSYLEERYARLGIHTVRQEFSWRGIRESNLIAVIPGTERGASNHPVVLADHIDTAFCEDIFASSHRRASAPGADDNVTAVATLLRAAETLANLKPRNDIWLLHLTGEEFPGDDLGARHFVSELLGARQNTALSQLLASRGELSGIILMDMIGYHAARDPIFQINAGDSPASVSLALAAQSVAESVAAPEGLVGVFRSRFDAKSYLYNTDGLTFSDAGIPVVLLNEHINGEENLNRSGYHQWTDTTRFGGFDFRYASAIARTAIETAARLAGAENSR